MRKKNGSARPLWRRNFMPCEQMIRARRMIKPIRIIAVVTAVAIGGAALAQDGTRTGPTGVVRGSVVSAPACPGPARIDQKNCATRPIQTSVSIYDASRQAIGAGETPLTVVATDGRGKFRVELAPGSYRLVPNSRGGITVGKPASVLVTAGSTADIQLLVESGMR
jgi:hypothetical protein